MKRENKTPPHYWGRGGLALAVAGALLLAAPAAQAQRPPFGYNDNNDPSRGGVRSLRANVSTDRTNYSPGRAVAITMTLTNAGNNPVNINLQNQYEYDVIVRGVRGGDVVWQWSRQRGGGSRERRTIRMNPGDTRTNRVLWDQTDDSGRRVAPGAYTVEARLYPQDPVTTQVYVGGRDDDGRPGPGQGIPRPFPTPPYDDGSPLRADLRASSDSVRAGDTVRFTYEVRNDGPRARTYRFSSGKQFDLAARSRETGRTVWRLSDDRMYTQALNQMTLEPGQRKTFTAEWRTDRRLDSGQYEVAAFLTPMGEREAAAARTYVRVGSGSGGRYDDRDERRGLPGSLEPRGAYRGRRGGRGAADTAARLRLRDLHPDDLGRRILLAGEYRGWRGGEGAPPVRRSDWVLADGGHTLYVSGPMPEARAGDTVTVTGTLRRAADGRLYLECD